VTIARHLPEHGPIAGDVLTQALRMTPSRFWTLIRYRVGSDRDGVSGVGEGMSLTAEPFGDA